MVEQDNGFLQKLLKTQYDAVFHLKDENGIEIYPIFQCTATQKRISRLLHYNKESDIFKHFKETIAPLYIATRFC